MGTSLKSIGASIAWSVTFCPAFARETRTEADERIQKVTQPVKIPHGCEIVPNVALLRSKS